MKKLLILGAGTSGTMMANHLHKVLPTKEWEISIVDQEETHYYQPGFLFYPFDLYKTKHLKKPIDKFITKGVHLVNANIDRIDEHHDQVFLGNGMTINYDILIIATGTHIAPEENPGLLGEEWHKSIFDFYTFRGSKALRNKLRTWEGGKLVVHIAEMPIKCPVAPLEFAFLADSFFMNKQMRDKVDITYVTPMSGAFTKPKATEALGHLLKEKNIHLVTDFNMERVDAKKKVLVDYEGTEVPYDLLVTVPTNMGDEVVARSGFETN